jgi:hypothetical protein
VRRDAVSLPDRRLWDKPCTCTSVSGGTVVQRSAVSGYYCESFVDLPRVRTETMKDGCGRDVVGGS